MKGTSELLATNGRGDGVAYQSSGIGAVHTEQGDRRLDILGRGGIGPQTVEGGSARHGELLGGGTQAGAGEANGEHGDWDGDVEEERREVELDARRTGRRGVGRNERAATGWWFVVLWDGRATSNFCRLAVT